MERISLGAAAVLGAVQGVTEFLPVSSDGHIALGALLMEIPNLPLSTVVVLHAGTLAATLAVFGSDVWGLGATFVSGLLRPREYFASDDGRVVTGLVLATAVTGVIGLVLEERVEAWSHVPVIVGACLLASAAWLWSTRWREAGSREVLPISASLLIGVAQGLAVLPGLSRSGSTIACAMLFGMSGPAAFRYSFLLSLPAVTGALLLQVLRPGALASIGVASLFGAAVAMVVGYAALRLLRGIVAVGKLWMFALYLVPVGIATIVWSMWSAWSTAA